MSVPLLVAGLIVQRAFEYGVRFYVEPCGCFYVEGAHLAPPELRMEMQAARHEIAEFVRSQVAPVGERVH